MNSKQTQKILKITNQSYEKIASDFSATRQQAWPEINSAVEKYVKDSDKILDLGCGNGRLLKSLEKLNFKNLNYIGIDNCSRFIKINQQNNKTTKQLTIKFICQDILDLSNFKNNSFDIIFSIASFNHIPSKQLRQKVLNEIYRILKPEGKLIMTNWNLWNLYNKKNIWKCKETPGVPKFGTPGVSKDLITLWQNKYPLYYRAFTKRELKKLFNKSKFKILENKYIKDGKLAYWWNAKNILTVGLKRDKN